MEASMIQEVPIHINTFQKFQKFQKLPFRNVFLSTYVSSNAIVDNIKYCENQVKHIPYQFTELQVMRNIQLKVIDAINDRTELEKIEELSYFMKYEHFVQCGLANFDKSNFEYFMLITVMPNKRVHFSRSPFTRNLIHGTVQLVVFPGTNYYLGFTFSLLRMSNVNRSQNISKLVLIQYEMEIFAYYFQTGCTREERMAKYISVSHHCQAVHAELDGIL